MPSKSCASRNRIVETKPTNQKFLIELYLEYLRKRSNSEYFALKRTSEIIDKA